MSGRSVLPSECDLKLLSLKLFKKEDAEFAPAWQIHVFIGEMYATKNGAEVGTYHAFVVALTTDEGRTCELLVVPPLFRRVGLGRAAVRELGLKAASGVESTDKVANAFWDAVNIPKVERTPNAQLMTALCMVTASKLSDEASHYLRQDKL